jgi:serine protease Do
MSEKVLKPTKQSKKSNQATYKASSIRPKKTFIKKFIYTLGVLIILTIILFTSLFSYVIIQKESQFSRWLVTNTALGDYLKLENSSTDQNTQNQQGIANDILGLDTEKRATSFDFSEAGQPLTVVETIEQILPSVVSISVSDSRQNQDFGAIASGTGFVVSKEGLVVTNKHVIATKCSQINNPNTKITILDNNQVAYDAKLLTVDPLEDMAILQIEGAENNFSPVKFFNNEQLKLGTGVIAVGNVLGELQNTVTKGIVSGLDRTLNTRVQDECTNTTILPEGLIQTDAAINKGNSGGPLFESSGLLVGINTYGAAEAQNIGLAIPSGRIISALESYQKNGKITRPRIGIYSRSVTPIDKKQYNWLPVDYGELIVSPDGSSAIEQDSPAQKAGLKDGDIILSVNGNKVKSSNSNPSPLKKIILNYQKDDTIKLEVLKTTGIQNGVFSYEKSPIQVDVKLGGVSIDLNKNIGQN